MITEENNFNAVLKKRVKRFGLYQLLIEDRDADFAADFSRNKKWTELDAIMKQKGL